MSDTPSLPAPDDAGEAIRTHLSALNTLLFGESARMGFEYLSVATLKEQDVNANVMAPEMFAQLVQNIRKSGVMESVPLCATRAGSETREVVSGHHRVRAAAEAGKTWIVTLVYYALTPDEIAAKQLAHNSIQGTSDPQLVEQLFARIGSIDLQIESYINPNALRVPDPVAFRPADLDLIRDSKTVTLVFLGTQAKDFARALELLGGKPDQVYVAHRDAFEGFKAAVTRVRRDLDVRAMPAAVAHMSQMVLQRLDALEPVGYDNTWVPLADVFGSTFIPPDVAAKLETVLDAMRDRGDLPGPLWTALQVWAEQASA